MPAASFAATTAQVLGERVAGAQSAWTGGGLAPVPCQYSLIAADLPFSRSLGYCAVLADQAAENLPALDPGSSSASRICGQSWTSTRPTTTGSGPIAAASSSARPGHPVADLSQEGIKRCSVLGGLINEYERAA